MLIRGFKAMWGLITYTIGAMIALVFAAIGVLAIIGAAACLI